MKPSWQSKFVELAHLVGSWSKDPSTKVGCCIVNEANRILSIGYNGFPAGVEDTDTRLNDRDTKLKYVIHAEANAIATAARSGISVAGGTLIVSALHPCADCAKLIIQAGITKVIAPLPEIDGRWANSFEVAATMFKESGVEVDFY